MKKILEEAYERFVQYEMDVDSEAPLAHRDFMWRLKECIDSYREYRKHEFCKAMNCSWFQHGTCTLKPGCSYSARQFHYCLKDNGFEIIKASKEVNAPCGNTECPEHSEYDPNGSNCALFFPANKEQCAHYRPYTAKEA